MWPEDGEVWYNHEIKQQRHQFVRTTAPHLYDYATLKQVITAASAPHEIIKLVPSNNNHQQNQREMGHELLKPQVQNRKQQQHSWLQRPTQKAVKQRSTKQPSFLGTTNDIRSDPIAEKPQTSSKPTPYSFSEPKLKSSVGGSWILNTWVLLSLLLLSMLGGRLLRRPTQSIAGDSEHLVQLIVAVIRVGIQFTHAKQHDGLFGSSKIEDTSGHWDWLRPYMVP
ncbi:unnamed protein product [Didymodactylos carnosus]|nr:unnamed protein product [Didymodactylos carnosus]CAF3914864.1 unnamed protein product [Didymodactylos carnosus]